MQDQRNHRMLKTAGLSFLLTLIVWVAFSWPLPRYMGEGIPFSSQNLEKDHLRTMFPGDHLQLMYHFQLFQGFLSGDTPWFHNLYEFNTGDDAATRRIRSYFFPFSLVFALISWISTDALAWNLCGLLSLWLTTWFTVLLVRVFVDHPLIPYAAGVIAICLPWRWVNLMGGSPMGFAMCWIPAFWLGATLLMRDKSWKGGMLCGLASLFMSFGDFQTYYFSLLSFPAWKLLTVIRFDCLHEWKAMIKPGIPGIVLVLIGLAHALYVKKGHANSTLDTGRTLDEVTNCSPEWFNFFTWQGLGLEAHPFLGYTLVTLLLASLVLIARKWKGRERLFGLAVFAGIGMVLAFGLGMNGPLEGHLITGLRKVIPAYDKIRQPLKIWCLLPTLLALASALGLGLLSTYKAASGTRRFAGFIIGITLILAVENTCQVRATICLLDPGNKAYAAVADEQAQPRALAIPLWPGDSDWSSLYEYYGMKYRVRMLNGYSPVIKKAYVNGVFSTYRSINQGELSPEQVRSLLERRIQYLILHENAFPENVSPWPVEQTLQRFRAHPQLEPIVQDGPVHAFRLRPEPGPQLPPPPDIVRLPARRYEAEHIQASGGQVEVIEDPAASNGQALFIHEAGITVQSVRPTFIQDGATGWYRARTNREAPYTWRAFTPLFPEPNMALFQYLPAPGEVIDYILYGALLEELPRSMPAASFFHGGYSNPEGEVFLQPLHDHAVPYYGYLVPRNPGTSTLTVHYRAPGVPAEARLGHFTVSPGVLAPAPLVNQPGQARVLSLVFPDNRPTLFAFHYDGTYPVTLERIELE